MPQPNAGAVNTSTKEGVSGYLMAKLNTQQTTNIAATDHLKLDTVLDSRGSDITLDTTTAYATGAGAASIGRLTLKDGKTYRLRANVPYVLGSGATGLLEVQFFNATDGTALVGSNGVVMVATTATNDSGTGVAEAIVTTTKDILVEVRIVTATALTQIGTTGARCATVFVETL